jgi:hypothetical protein
MKRISLVPLILLSLLSLAPPVGHYANAQTPPGKTAPKKSMTVWVNLPTGVYHFPHTRWYGKTKNGEYMSEDKAKAKGYRAAMNGQ